MTTETPNDLLLQSVAPIHGPDAMDTLGGRIGRAREALGQTTAHLARTLGVQSKTLAAWESDRSEPRANKLVTLAGLLNVSPSWLIVGHGDAPDRADQLGGEQIGDGAELDRLKALQAQITSRIAQLEEDIIPEPAE